MSKTKIALLAYLATAVALIIGIGFLCYNKSVSTDTAPLTWFISQIIAMIVGISFTLQYLLSNYFNADGNYSPEEAATTGVVSGIGTFTGALLLMYAAYVSQWTLALNLFIIFEVICFVVLFLVWSIPSVSKSGHARMTHHADDMNTTPTHDRTPPRKPMSVGMVIGIVLVLAIVSRLAMCSSTQSTQVRQTGQTGRNSQNDPTTTGQTQTETVPLVTEPTPSVPPPGWGQSQFNAMNGSNQNSNSVTFEQPSATGTESGQMK